jgi:hypothetical protein
MKRKGEKFDPPRIRQIFSFPDLSQKILESSDDVPITARDQLKTFPSRARTLF